LNGQAFAAIALHCPLALLPGRQRGFFTMYRSAFLAAALLSIAQAAKAEAKAERGFASYYGGRGHRGVMTCAHRTRSLGSIVTVTRASHSVQCRVNDRGPFVRGRVIDVSIGAARALGMTRAGVVRVSVQ
jgi:rare lipoprotein A